MLHKRLLAAGAGVTLALGAAACNNDNITNLNENPNSPEDVPAATLFTNAARLGVSRWLGTTYDLRQTEFVAQHLAEVQYPNEDQYVRLGANDTRASFDNAYSGELEDLQKVAQKGAAAQDAGVYGPALVLRTWGFSYLTDTWGDVPYSAALKGDSAGGSISPAYDAQKSIYADFFAQLDKASKDMAAAKGAGLGGADPIYGGRVAGWQKFANSLRARLALRLVNVDPATADAQLKAAFAAPGGVFTSNADNAILDWPGDGVYNNPWADNFKTRDDHRMSQTLVNILIANNDPRLAVYAQPTPADPTTYAGMPNGLTAANAAKYLNTASRPSAYFYPPVTSYGTFPYNGQSYPSYLMTYAELLLIKAEAAARGLGGLSAGQANGFFQDALRASMQQWGLNSAAIATYLGSANGTLQSGTPGLKQIATQKWVALYSDGGNAWAEWRRTCQPSTIKPGPAAAIATVPRRFQYSITERSVNDSSRQAAIARQGPDAFQTRVYWDTKPQAAPTYEAGCGQR